MTKLRAKKETELQKSSKAQTLEMDKIIKQCEARVEEANQQNQALVLQRKTLMQAKESARKEIEKLLKQVETAKQEQVVQ